jgi:ElaB/YqjD/DUF883 family membrane-anchored ribosome-binding protein
MSASAVSNDAMGRPRADGAAGTGAGQAAERAIGVASSEVSNLIADVEDLLTRVAHVADADVTKLRESLRQKIGAARDSISAGGQRVGQMARTAATTTDGYVHHNPWQAIGIAAALGAAVGFLLAKR